MLRKLLQQKYATLTTGVALSHVQHVGRYTVVLLVHSGCQLRHARSADAEDVSHVVGMQIGSAAAAAKASNGVAWLHSRSTDAALALPVQNVSGGRPVQVGDLQLWGMEINVAATAADDTIFDIPMGCMLSIRRQMVFLPVQDVSGGRPVQVGAGDLPLWGMEIDVAAAAAEIRNLGKEADPSKGLDGFLGGMGLGWLAEQLKDLKLSKSACLAVCRIWYGQVSSRSVVSSS